VKKEKVIDGSSIRAADVVIGVDSSGLHSNGFTLARRVLQSRHSLNDRLDQLGSRLGDAMLTPTRIYVKPVLEAIRDFQVHGIAHITGGAFTKLKRLVGDRKLQFALDPIDPPPIFKLIQEEGNLTELEMLRTFNMGVGLCLVAPASQSGDITRVFGRRGFRAREIGTIRRGSGVRVGSLVVAD